MSQTQEDSESAIAEPAVTVRVSQEGFSFTSHIGTEQIGTAEISWAELISDGVREWVANRPTEVKQTSLEVTPDTESASTGADLSPSPCVTPLDSVTTRINGQEIIFEYDTVYSAPSKGQHRWVHHNPFIAVDVTPRIDSYVAYVDGRGSKPEDRKQTESEAIVRAVEKIKSLTKIRCPAAFSELEYDYCDVVMVDWSDGMGGVEEFVGVTTGICSSPNADDPLVDVAPFRDKSGNIVADPSDATPDWECSWHAGAGWLTPFSDAEE